MVFLAWRLARPRPSLLLDEQGLEDRGSALGSAGRVAWSEVARATVEDPVGGPYLCVWVRDHEAAMARLGAVDRWSKRSQAGFFDGEPPFVMVPSAALDRPLDEVLDLVRGAAGEGPG